MTMEHLNYIPWGLEQTKINLSTIQPFKLNLKIGVELYSQHYA